MKDMKRNAPWCSPKVIIIFTPHLYQSVTEFRNLNAADRHTRTHEKHGDDKSLNCVCFPFQKVDFYAAYASVLCVCVCPIASSVEPTVTICDVIYFKATKTP